MFGKTNGNERIKKNTLFGEWFKMISIEILKKQME